MQDYGGPVGFRMALAHPDRVEALIVQDAVAHNEGLGANWKTRRAFWADRAAYEAALRTNLISLQATRTRHVGNDPNPERYDPDLWTDEYAFLNKPGEPDIQSDLFYDYRTNVEAYPKWQAWMQKTQPRLLVLWGKYESSFAPTETEAYRRDVPKAEVHILDGGCPFRQPHLHPADLICQTAAHLEVSHGSSSSQPIRGRLARTY
jgi:pimeloyl-ACP methyl ester carboxylesterase